MKEKEIYSLRQIRQKVIEICGEICVQKWKTVDNDWKILEKELAKPIFLETICDKLLEECRECAAKNNYVRLYDLLRYETDPKIAAKLSEVTEDDRRILSDWARKKNLDELQKYHQKIFTLVKNVKKSSRIFLSYTGTENVSIFVREGVTQYQLFSSVNPWLENANFVNRIVKKELNEILILGFGGGHLIRELGGKFRKTKIKVYLSNMDIFMTVINHILVYEILQNENLEFHFDSFGLSFFIQMQENMRRNEHFAFYINEPELRACVGGDEADRLINDIGVRMQNRSLQMCEMMDLVGTKIEHYIINSFDSV